MTELVAKASRSGQKRQDYSKRIHINNLQTRNSPPSTLRCTVGLATSRMLVHSDRKVILFIDVDASKADGFGAMIHRIEGHLLKAKEHSDRIKYDLSFGRQDTLLAYRVWTRWDSMGAGKY